jgi:ATP-dependent helicase/nuclease subunit A
VLEAGLVRLPRRLLAPLDLQDRAVSERTFTDEQRRAIERREGGLLVAAGAGSGKTSVLVERFARAVLDDGVAVDAILAITFTEKAAAELKARVRDRFASAGHHAEARAAEGAFVATIHGFCSTVLRSHALAAGIDPEYRVLDALEADRLGVEAFDGALAAFLHDDAGPERLRLVAAYTPDRLAAMTRTAYGHLRSQGQEAPELPEIDPPQPADEQDRLAHAARTALAELTSAADGIRVTEARERLQNCLDLLSRGWTADARPEDDHPPGAIPKRTGDGRPRVPASLDLTTLDTLKVGRTANALKTDAFDDYRTALDALRALISHQQELRDHALLRDLLRAYGERYAALKRARSGLDFDDLELLVNRLLRDDAVVRERWAGRFAHVMIDEFQDTNPLQNELLGRIAGDRLFRVGDEFQSIYRFRHADVSVFREQAERARADGSFEALTANFRSRPEVLAAIDLLFGSVWGERFARLRAGREGAAPLDGPAVELIVADRQHTGARWRERFEGDAAAGDGPPAELAFGESLRDVVPGRAAEARMLAKRIDELIASGRFAAGDVVVLVRATTHLAAYERALEDRGIPTYVMGGRGYWSQQQVGDLRAYLAALANPLDDLALYTALASPIGGLSLDALVVLRTAARAAGVEPWTLLAELVGGTGDGPLGGTGDGRPLRLGTAARTSITRPLSASAADGRAVDRARDLAAQLGEDDAGRARDFAALLVSERAAAPRSSLEALIDRGVTRSGYDLHLLGQSQGRRRMANVRKLMRLAREFEAEEGRDLRRFIDYVAERDELGDRQGEAPLEPEDVQAVRLMTVHRAKGLEFPCVCVADLGKPGREDRSALQISDDGAVGISLAQLGGGSVASARLKEIRERQKLADEEEEKRVFYVAATRAEEHLILSGGTDLEKLSEEQPLEEPMRWIWRALAPELADVDTTAVVEQGLDGSPVAIRCTVLRPETVDAVLPAADRAPRPPEQPPASLHALDSPALTAVPPPAALPISRVSYSGLQRHRECGYRFYLERSLRLPRGEALPEPVTEGEEEPVEALPPTVRGSIAHLLLEEVDFAAPATPTPERVAALIERHREPVREHEVEDLIVLFGAFADSPLRARLAAAERVRVELPFAFELQPEADLGRTLLVNGFVDVHAVEPDRTLIVDYKTNRLEGAEPAAVVESDYTIQRTVYALAALRAGAPRAEVSYLFLERPDDPVAAVYEAADVPALEAELRTLASPVAHGDFQPTDNPHRALCADCPGQPGLCSWPPERTLGLPAHSG